MDRLTVARRLVTGAATAGYALLMAIPVVLVFIVLQRALLKGSLAAPETD